MVKPFGDDGACPSMILSRLTIATSQRRTC